jgi:hypothetical protein
MATLGVRKTAWQNLSARDREMVRAIGVVLDLGVPAEWAQPDDTRWYLFCDTRFRLVDLAYFGALAAHLDDIPPGYQIPMVDILDGDGNKIGEFIDRPQLRSDAKTFLDAYVVWPVTVPDDDPNPWQTVLDAQGTPAAMQMADHPPAGWEPVEVTP